MIDKKKLMKTAWEIARNGFYKTALESIIGKAHFSEKTIKDICRYGIPTTKGFFERAHVQKEMNIDFTVRDFFAESLRIAWTEAKKAEEKEFEKMLTVIEQEHATANTAKVLAHANEINKNAPRRRLVAADKYSEGDKLGNFIVTGLGKTFRPNVDMFSLGITPDTDYVQYVYFN